jgi:hypothetical protein
MHGAKNINLVNQLKNNHPSKLIILQILAKFLDLNGLQKLIHIKNI